MKKAKRLVSLLLAFVMLMSLAIGVGATPTEQYRDHAMEGPEIIYDGADTATSPTNMQGKGVITITNASVGETYKLYQILYLESYDTTGATSGGDPSNLSGGKYVYKVNSSWTNFVSAMVTEGYLEYVKSTGSSEETSGSSSESANTYVAWKGETTPARVADFAQLAKKFADSKEAEGSSAAVYAMKPIKEITASATGGSTAKEVSIVFDNLKLGYYLVDSSLGALCNLDTTNNAVNMKEKNPIPTNYKQVKEDSDGKWKGSSTESGNNNADIGQVVEFLSNIDVTSGKSIEKLIFHDKMDAGLTFLYNATTETKVDSATESENDRIKVYYTTNASGSENKTYLEQDNQYSVVTEEIDDGCTFHIVFKPEFLESLGYNAYNFKVEYKAQLNRNAKVGSEGNDNISKISYGDNNTFTKDSKTTTQTYELPIRKIAGEGVDVKGLSGAKFSLKLSSDGAEKIKFVKDDSCDSNFDPSTIVDISDTPSETPVIDKYRVATPEEIATGTGIIDTITTGEDGYFVLVGLDAATYTLTEEEAPKGFTKLENPLTVQIGDDGTITWAGNTVQMMNIQNKSGTELPSTGGIGTTIFYVAGSILLIGAAVLLIVKKRMSNEK